MAARMQEDPFEDLPDEPDDDDDDKPRRRVPGWVFPPVGSEQSDPARSPYVDARV